MGASMPRRTAACVAILIAGLAACGDKVQFAEPPGGDAAGAPPAGSPRFHGAAPEGGAGGSRPVESHGAGADPFAEAEVGEAMPAPGVPSMDVFFRGRIELDPSIQLPGRYAVFVSAGFPPRGRPPVLSKRIDGTPPFPLEFTLTPADIAFGSTSVDPERPLVLYATISESGVVVMPGQTARGFYLNSPPSEPCKPGAEDAVILMKESR